MVGSCRQNVVDGPFSWLGTRPVILGRGLFDYFCLANRWGCQKAHPKLTTPASNGSAKNIVRISLQLFGGIAGFSARKRKRLWSKGDQSRSSILWSERQKVQGFAPQILVSQRAFGPCVLRWKMLTHFLSSAPCRVRFPPPGTYIKMALVPKRAKAVKTILWSGRRESNPRHQLGRLGFYH